ncbi:MAG: hypothetical protein M3Q52_10005 [Pseudomonadota bacterium]|nr:hypothetical protein [Pseudomonadota bacterium]
MTFLSHPQDSSTGVSISAPVKQRRPRSLAPPVLARSVRRAEDTALGCRNLADRGLAEAAMMDTVNGRARLEASAAVWLVRAQLLDRVESSEQARLTAGQARCDEDGEQLTPQSPGYAD